MLVVDGEHFHQWFEGPAAVVTALWQRIRSDTRQTDITLRGTPILPMRAFAGWEMELGWNDLTTSSCAGTVQAGGDLLAAQRAAEKEDVEHWQSLAQASTTFDINNDTDVLNGLVEQLIHSDGTRARVYLGTLREAGLSSRSLLLDLFDPAVRHLGDLWLADTCSAADLAIRMAWLQNFALELAG
jgi:Sensors of blue-light using FAD